MIEEPSARVDTWREKVGAADTYGRSSLWARSSAASCFARRQRPDDSWTVPRHTDDAVRPKKNTEGRRELLAEIGPSG